MGIPCAAADVAAPILKEWPENWLGGRLDAARSSFRCFRNQAEDMGKPSGVRNRGSGEKPNLCLKSANLNMAKKGQNGPSVRAMTMVHAPLDLVCLRDKL